MGVVSFRVRGVLVLWFCVKGVVGGVMRVVSRVSWALVIAFGVLLWWIGTRFSGVCCGWVYGMFVALLMVVELLKVWVCMLMYVCLVA